MIEKWLLVIILQSFRCHDDLCSASQAITSLASQTSLYWRSQEEALWMLNHQERYLRYGDTSGTQELNCSEDFDCIWKAGSNGGSSSVILITSRIDARRKEFSGTNISGAVYHAHEEPSRKIESDTTFLLSAIRGTRAIGVNIELNKWRNISCARHDNKRGRRRCSSAHLAIR